MNRAVLWTVLLLLPAAAAAEHHAGGMTRQEFLDRHARMFDKWDRDADGVLSPAEHAAMHAEHHGPAAAPQRPRRPLLHPSK